MNAAICDVCDALIAEDGARLEVGLRAFCAGDRGEGMGESYTLCVPCGDKVLAAMENEIKAKRRSG